ncbi:MAG TPA: PEGA domain-containing protein [Kofleriaceae bacterium]|nr:PEGA domain-containing protein [Kofleriaceae bacterium]
MRGRRIIAISSDDALGSALAEAARTAGGDVELHRSFAALGALPAAIYLVHLADAATRDAIGQLGDDSRVVVVLPRSSLAPVVELMQASTRVAAVLVAEELDPGRLAALVRQLVTGELFGLARIVAPGTPIERRQVRDYEERSQCIAEVAALVEREKLPRNLHATIEQCLDEMLVNALYDAPVDDRGARIFGGIAPRARVAMRIEQTVEVEYAIETVGTGKRLALAVRDAYGSLDRGTVLRVLHKCLHAEHKVDRHAAGAGVGLYLVMTSASTVGFHVVPGIATEATCTFDVSGATLAQFEFLAEPTDVTGTLVTARKPAGSVQPIAPAPPRSKRTALVLLLFAIAMGLGIGGLVLLRRPHRPPARATVELDSDPAGAQVIVDGKPAGGTPVALTTLRPGSTATVTFEQRGYVSATAQVRVPAAGERARHVEKLALSDKFVRVRFVSTPPGARVIDQNQPPSVSRTYTPAEIFVEAGKPQRFTLTMPKHAPLVIEPFTPTGRDVIEKGGELKPLP